MSTLSPPTVDRNPTGKKSLGIPYGAFLLPPHVLERLAKAGTVVSDRRTRHGYVQRTLAEGFKAARHEAYCWAFALRWRDKAVVDLGGLLLAHEEGPEPSPLFAGLAQDVDYIKGDIGPSWRKVHWGSADRGVPEHERRLDMPNMDADQTVAYLTACLAYCESAEWPGRTGRTDRLLYQAIVNRALGLERPSHRLPISVYQAQQLAGFAYRTSRLSLERLRNSGHLAVMTRATRSSKKASEYMIRWPLDFPVSAQLLSPKGTGPGGRLCGLPPGQTPLAVKPGLLCWGEFLNSADLLACARSPRNHQPTQHARTHARTRKHDVVPDVGPRRQAGREVAAAGHPPMCRSSSRLRRPAGLGPTERACVS